MDLSIITVTYQSKAFIDKCIMSVVTSAFSISYEHIVVDNDSADGTAEFIEEGYSSYVSLLKNDKNLGFAAANNQALLQAKGRYILFLNPDMQICRGTLDALVSWMDAHRETGAAGCKLVTTMVSYSESQQQEIPTPRFETPSALLRPSRFFSPFSFLPYFFNLKTFGAILASRFSYPSFDEDLEQEVDHIRGSFLLVRKEILDSLGFGFDPRYFILFEDVDLCREIKRLGYKIFYTPQVACIDYLGRSLSLQKKIWKYRQLTRSFKKYVKKWHSPFHLIWLNFVIPIGFLLRIPEWGLTALREKIKLF